MTRTHLECPLNQKSGGSPRQATPPLPDMVTQLPLRAE